MPLPSPHPERQAVITGASSGIGVELARGLARRGHRLLLVARRRRQLDELALELTGRYDVEVSVRPCDLADAADRGALAAELRQQNVSVLCNNAGYGSSGRLDQLDPLRERDQVAVNVTAVHELTLAVLPRMIEQRSGAILIVGSTAGWQPIPRSATYAASKAFANSFAESLHTELRPVGVTVTLLAPGPVKTEFANAAGLAHFADVGPRMMWTTAERNAQAALAAMERGTRVVEPGAWAKAQGVLGRYSPRFVLLRVLHAGARRLS